MKIGKIALAAVLAVSIPFAGVTAAEAKGKPEKPAVTKVVYATNAEALDAYAIAKDAFIAAKATYKADPTKANFKIVTKKHASAIHAYDAALKTIKKTYETAVAPFKATKEAAELAANTAYNDFIVANPSATVEEIAAAAATRDTALADAKAVFVAATAEFKATKDADIATLGKKPAAMKEVKAKKIGETSKGKKK